MNKIPFVDLSRQWVSIGNEIDAAIKSCIDRFDFVGGEIIDEFARKFEIYTGAKFCVPVANGTDALELALMALGIEPNDEVIVPAHTWISTASAVVQVGAKPVFCDTVSGTYLLDLDVLPQLITSRTKAIIPVHFAGQMVNMDLLLNVAKSFNLFVIEDCAQAHGAIWNGQHAGTWGDIGTFSFYPGKNLGAFGDAGAVITQSEILFDKIRRLSNHGQIQRHQHQVIGRNSRMDSIQAAILNVKLNYLDAWTAARKQIAMWYKANLPEQVLPVFPTDGMAHVYHLFVIQAPNRAVLQHYLGKEGIETSIHYPKPLTELEIFLNVQTYRCSSASHYVPKILSLPMFPELTEEEVKRISLNVSQFLEIKH